MRVKFLLIVLTLGLLLSGIATAATHARGEVRKTSRLTKPKLTPTMILASERKMIPTTTMSTTIATTTTILRPRPVESTPTTPKTPQTPIRVLPRPLGVSAAGWVWPWSCIAEYEAEPPWNPATNTGNGYYGGLQFLLSTWQNHGGAGRPDQATIPEQEAVADAVVRSDGGSYREWSTASRCGLPTY